MTDESDEPTAQELRERAERLRDCARRAEGLVEPLSTHIDAEVEIAVNPDVWTGTYATEATELLVEYKRDLRKLAADLEEAVNDWRGEADRLDEQADEKE